jgi:hypothetical protein
MPNFIKITDVNLSEVQNELRTTFSFATGGLNYLGYLEFLNERTGHVRLLTDIDSYGSATASLINRFSTKYGPLIASTVALSKRGEGRDLTKNATTLYENQEITSLVNVAIPLTSATVTHAWHRYTGGYILETINPLVNLKRYIPADANAINNEEMTTIDSVTVFDVSKLHSYKNLKPGVAAILDLTFLNQELLYEDLKNNNLLLG